MKRPPTRPRRAGSLAARAVVAIALAAATHGAIASDATAQAGATGPIATRSGAIDAAPESGRDARPWIERRQWLGSLRWWADPEHVERLRALSQAGVAVRVEWAVPADADDGITPAEREVLCGAKSIALRSGAGTGPDAGTEPAAAVDVDGCAGRGTLTGVPLRADGTPVPGYGLRARVTDAWRPYRLLNLLLVALPGPSAPFMTQGGAASEIEVVDDAGRAVAGFECRGYAGIAQFVHAFGRIGHTRAALRECARAFHATLRDGRLPGDATGAGADGPPAVDPSSVN